MIMHAVPRICAEKMGGCRDGPSGCVKSLVFGDSAVGPVGMQGGGCMIYIYIPQTSSDLLNWSMLRVWEELGTGFDG